jgi:DNA sulfur modification protein DndD
LIAGFPTDLDEWKLAEVKSAIESERLTDENLKFLDTVLTSLNPPLGKKNLARIHKSSEELAQSSIADSVKSPLSHFDFATFTAFEKRVSELSIIGSREDTEQIISESIQKLKQFELTSQKIRKATEGLNIAELANELKSNGMALGGKQADYSRMNDEINAKIAAIESVEAQITSLKRKIGHDSSLQRKQEIVEKLQIVLSKYGIEHRATVAKPLEEAFAEGFRLLSRKADRIEEVAINPETYQTELKMQGFEGNWLDRDLSATEKQHVGLSLLFALRKVGNRAIPVVIDTPTSRMDSEHKGWSVTRFYPKLSHQVIVLATSDDLSNGLYEELLSTKALGAELLVEEISNDSVAVRSANLAAFFGV